MVEMAVDGLRAFLDSNGAFLDSDGEEQVTRADDGARWNNIQRFSATTATPRMVDPRGFSEWRMHVDLNGQRWMPDREPLYRFGPDREPL